MVGQQLGHYLIEAHIGSGGMGSVYRALDTRLNRIVAVKVIDGRFGDRFGREAKTIASITHAHVCTLYDIGENYLVMEYIDGKPIKGPLSLDDVVRLGAQIAEALGAAHKKGVVHRDLKPGNVLVTEAGVKVIDFGLAKQIVTIPNPEEATLSEPLTNEGTLLGTVPYMSPEQLRGKEPDARSDIFALGCVLYEMVTGKRAFEGKTQASIMAAILETEPTPITQVQPLTPPWLDRIIRRCLKKRPDERWHSANDVSIELREPPVEAAPPPPPPPAPTPTPPPPPAPPVPSTLPWVAAGVAIAVAVVALGWSLMRVTPQQQLPNIWTSVLPPEDTAFSGTGGLPEIALSRDGQRLAAVAVRGGERSIFVRSLDSLNWSAVPDTKDGRAPFWSPDGRAVGFWTAGKLRRIDLSSGQLRTLCECGSAGSSGAWSSGKVFFKQLDALYWVAETGGTPVLVPGSPAQDSEVGASAGELPGGQLLYVNRYGQFAGSWQGIKSIGSHVSPLYSNLQFVPLSAGTKTGHILYGLGTRLFARPFDAGRLAFTGDAVPIIEGVDSQFNIRRFSFAASESGVVVYASAQRLRRRLQWLDRTGQPQQTLGAVAEYDYVRISPDGLRIAYTRRDPDTNKVAASTARVDGSQAAQLELGEASSSLRLTWSPDGQQVATSDRSADRARSFLTIRSVSGMGPSRRLLERPQLTTTSWSPDGKYILFNVGSGAKVDLWTVVATEGERSAKPAIQSPGFGGNGVFSPDGRYIAYTESNGIRLKRFPVTDEVWQVSQRTARLAYPRWRRDGQELYYSADQGDMMAVPIRLDGPKPEIGEAKRLFQFPPTGARMGWDVSPDGQRFLFAVPASQDSTPALHLVTNWRTLLGDGLPAQ